MFARYCCLYAGAQAQSNICVLARLLGPLVMLTTLGPCKGDETRLLAVCLFTWFMVRGGEGLGLSLGTNANNPVTLILDDDETHIFAHGQVDTYQNIYVGKWAVNTGSQPSTPIWSRDINGGHLVEAGQMCRDSAGDVYITGHTVTLHASLDTGQYTVTGSSNKNSFIVKLNGADGTTMWMRDPAVSAADDFAWDCLFDSSGNLVVLGTVYGAVTGGTHGGDWDDYFVKMNPADGSIIARTQDSSAGFQFSRRMTMSANGNLVLFGHSIIPGGGFLRLRLVDSTTLAVQQTHIEDLVLTAAPFLCSSFDVTGLVTDANNNIYVSAMVHNVGYCLNLVVNGNYDVIVIKYQPDLTRAWVMADKGTWAHEFQGALSYHAPSDRLYFVGSTDATIAQTPQGGSDLFLVVINPSDGSSDEVFQFGSSQLEDPYAMAQAHDGTMYLGVKQDSKSAIWRLTLGENCPPGSEFIPSNDKPTMWNACKQCDDFHISTVNGTAACTRCAGGYLPSADRTVCIACPAGTMQNGTACSPCPTGFTSAEGSINCWKCPLGEVASTGGQCVPCRLGSYGVIMPDGLSGCSECPYGSTTLGIGAPLISYCTCIQGEYGDPLGSNPRNCTQCPPNSECDGGLYPQAKKGFYLPFDSYDEGSVVCVPSEACPGGMESCSTGYESYKCTDCASGYYRSQQTCKLCPTTSIAVLVITGIAVCFGVIAFLIFALLWVFSKRMRSVRRIFLFILKIIPAIVRMASLQVAFLQMAQTVFTMGINVSFPLKDEMQSIVDIASIDIGSVANAECSSGQSVGYVPKYLLKMMVVPALVVLFVFIGILGTGCKFICILVRRRRSRDEADSGPFSLVFAIIGVFFSTLNILYYPIHTMALDPWRCEETDSGVYVIKSFPSENCYETGGTWALGAALSTVFILLYCIGIPVIFTLVLVLLCNKSLRRKSILSRVFHFLLEKFEDKFYFWEMVIMSKKFLVGLSISVISTGAYDQGVAVMGVLGGMLMLHCLHRPFVSSREDNMELISLTVMLFLTFLGLTSKSHAVHGVTGVLSSVLEISMLLLVIGQGLFFAVVIASLVWDEVRIAKKAYNDDDDLDQPVPVGTNIVAQEPSPFSECERGKTK